MLALGTDRSGAKTRTPWIDPGSTCLVTWGVTKSNRADENIWNGSDTII